MKVLVIGANGQVGEKVVDKLRRSQHEPKAMVRKKGQMTKFERKEAEVVLADLEEDISHAFKDVEGVVFTAGSGGDTGKDKTELIDRMGAIKAIDEAVNHKVKRFIMVSAFGSDFDPSEWKEEMAHYYQAKAAADRYLMKTDLDYTILKPGRLTNDIGNDSIEIAERTKQRGGSIPRMDVATTIVKILDVHASFKKSYELLEGDTPIEQALASLEE
ncbi:MAG: SDR family oxidoreductase [Balneolaceae bacterium]